MFINTTVPLKNVCATGEECREIYWCVETTA
jgi:hypothetical protein